MMRHMLSALATTYPEWMRTAAQVMALSPIIPGVVVMVVATARPAGPQASRLMMIGGALTIAGMMVSFVLFKSLLLY
jgi:hypothetical protein